MVKSLSHDYMPDDSRFAGLTVLQAAVLVAKLHFSARKEDLATVLGCSVRNVDSIFMRIRSQGFSVRTGRRKEYTLDELGEYIGDFFEKYLPIRE